MSRRKRNISTRFSLFAFQDIITCVMGIMLLLTLMLSLKIVAVPDLLDPSHDKKSVEQLSQEAGSLRAELQALESAIANNTQQFSANALLDQELLSGQRQQVMDENRRISRDNSTLQSAGAAAERQSAELASENVRRADEQAEIDSLNERAANLRRQLQELQDGQRVVYNTHTAASRECWLVELTDAGDIKAAPLGRSEQPISFASAAELESWITALEHSQIAFLLIVKPNAAPFIDSLTDALRTRKIMFGFDLLPQDVTALDPVTGALPK